MSQLIGGEYNQFKIGQQVWHSTNAEAGQGVVTNWRLWGDDGSVDYQVSFGPGHHVYMTENEMTVDKPVDL